MKKLRLRLIPALTTLLLSAAAPATPATRVTPDWAAALREDAQALHQSIAANHPGPENRLDPAFTRRNDAGLALALRRAAQVHDFPGYLWAMRGYVASFDDGHVQFGPSATAPNPVVRWPGFLTGDDGHGKQVVATRAEDSPVPLGASLVGCDGVPVDRLLVRNVGAFRGRWMLLSQRMTSSGRLLLDVGNPFIARPHRCSFNVDGRLRSVTLQWRLMPSSELAARLGETAPRVTPPIAARTLPDGTRWYSLSSFDGDPASATAKALVSLIATMRHSRAAIVASPRVVLDLRGNGGGSSDWSRQIAQVLWSPAAVDAVERQEHDWVEWRASPSNLATLQGYQREWAHAPGVSAENRQWVERATSGMAAAIARHEPLWREPATPPTSGAAITEPASVVRGTAATRVFVLTDWGCGSACLDAVDLWRALGAVQVGQETSADTLYMDVREEKLPSGYGEIALPMKVYRGRPRGSNVPLLPAIGYRGDMRDTAALERWIATL